MNHTILRSLHPGSDSFSIDIDYGTDSDYSFILEDGSVRCARVNSLDNFASINQIARVALYFHVDFQNLVTAPDYNAIVLCDNTVPLPFVTPQSYMYKSHCFRLILTKVGFAYSLLW